MNLKSGLPFPLIKSGLLYEYPSLEEDIATDVVILGGGISGALTSYYLTTANISNIVVDARSIGLGSTAASTSLLQYEIDTPLYKLIRLRGKREAIKAYKECERAIHVLKQIALEIGLKEFRMKKSLQVAQRSSHIKPLKTEMALRKNAGFQIEWIDEHDLKNSFGMNAPAAIYSSPAADTDSYLFTHYLHQYNLRKGARVFDRTTVLHFESSKNAVTLKTSTGKNIRAKKIVFATGYEVKEFINKPIVKLKTTYATISEPLPASFPFWRDDCLIWDTGNPYLYARSSGKRIMVGGRDEDLGRLAKQEKLIMKKSSLLVKDFMGLTGIEIVPEFSWSGLFGYTKDGLPYIGSYQKIPNSYFALGFGGNGITFSAIAGEIIRDLVIGKKNPSTQLYSFDR